MPGLLARLAPVLPLCACGVDASESGPIEPQRLASLDITLEGDGSLDPTKIQFALVWYRDKNVWPKRQLEAQELFVAGHSLSWPVHYDLAVTEKPTYDPYWSSAYVGFRWGTVVAYLDDNANGRLDWTPVTGSAFVDRIVGYNPMARYVYYSTVDVYSYNPENIMDMDVATPVTLFDRSEPRESCNLLEDWEPYTAYRAVFGPIQIDPREPGHGPWDMEASTDAPCPGNMIPALTTEISCDGHALETAHASTFIAQTCGQVVRVCQFTPYMEPGNCTCDETKYYCTAYEGGL